MSVSIYQMTWHSIPEDGHLLKYIPIYEHHPLDCWCSHLCFVRYIVFNKSHILKHEALTFVSANAKDM